MLRTLRVDNFKCLDGFELTLDGHALLMGLNGSGKSTVVELLDRLRRFWVGGEKATDCFPAATRTRWIGAGAQSFTLRLERDERWLELRVVLRPPDEQGIVRVEEEEITGPEVAIRRQATASIELGGGPSSGQQLLVPDELSVLPLLWTSAARTPAIAWALEDASSFIPFRLEPAAMESLAQNPAGSFGMDGRSFASWLLGRERHFASVYEAIQRRAAEVLPGFERFVFVQEGEQFRLWTEWRSVANLAIGPNGSTRRYHFGELSDGQRLIFVLSALVEIAQEREMTLILDEPDNYVALQELQPLLFSLMDTPTLQLIVVSHHPEVIDLMARDFGYVLVREGDVGPVRVRRFQAPAGTMLPASALVARGDIHGGA